MTLKPATDFITDASYSFTAVQVTPKAEGIGPDAVQKKDKQGLPLWTVDALRTGHGDAALLSVTVAAATAPQVSGPVAFKGLRGAVWLGERPRQGGLFWQADGVQPARPQS